MPLPSSSLTISPLRIKFKSVWVSTTSVFWTKSDVMSGNNWRLPINSQIEPLLIFAFCVLCQDFYVHGRGGSQFYYEGFKTFGKMPGSSKAGTTMLMGEKGTSVVRWYNNIFIEVCFVSVSGRKKVKRNDPYQRRKYKVNN